MKSILAIAAALLATACAGTGGSGGPASGIFSPSSGPEADLRARYQKYRTGPPPYLDYETWKRTMANPRDYTGSGS
jgi:hypothetical protein